MTIFFFSWHTLSSKGSISLLLYVSTVIFNLFGGSWMLLRLWWKLWNIVSRKIHKLTILFPISGGSWNLRSLYWDPRYRASFRVRKTSGDLTWHQWLLCPLYPTCQQETKIEIYQRGNILCPYLPCDSPPLFSALLTASWEHIFKFGSSWCLLAAIQWLIIWTASFSCWDTRGLLISQYILLFDLHTNHQCRDGFFDTEKACLSFAFLIVK